MRIYKILIVLLCSVFCSCNWETSRDKTPLLKRKVLVLVNEGDSIKTHEYQTDGSQSDTSYLDLVFKNNALTNLMEVDSSIQIDLRYADTSNFLHLNLYDGLKNAYLDCEAAIKLSNAQYYLKKINPQLSLVVLDASRPLHIQQMMWDSLEMPNLKKYQYLSPPSEPSLHNYGCAVDVTLVDVTTGQLLDMGTQFDHFEKLSEPMMEQYFLKSGELSTEAYHNRLLLRKVMQKAKYNPITTEWWHFSICTKPEAVKKFKLIQ